MNFGFSEEQGLLRSSVQGFWTIAALLKKFADFRKPLRAIVTHNGPNLLRPAGLV